MEIQDLLEPNKAFKTQVKDVYHQNVTDYFDELTEKSQVDVALNKDTNNKIISLEKVIKDLEKNIKGRKSIKSFLLITGIIFILISIGLLIYGFINKIEMPTLLFFILIPIVLVGLAIFFLIYQAKVVKPQIKKLEKDLEKENKNKDKLLQDAKEQMLPLNALFKDNIPTKLINKTVPLFKIDESFDINKLEYLKQKHGFKENLESNISSLFVQSGSILGNPFIIERNYVQEMTNQTYQGSIIIHWTTYEHTSKGTRSVHHSQTLTAEVTKPKPYYYKDTWLVYSNDAAPNLEFSRKPTSVNSMNKKQLEKYIKDFDKKEDKAIEKAHKKGEKAITEMSNTEFEALFDALNRTNEVEFRLLFTPLAQKSMIELLKDNVTGYGDDFIMVKKKTLNYVKSNHSQTFNIEAEKNIFYGYNYENMKTTFINYCDEYMKSFYFNIAPLMCIPLYQQNQTFEYIYEGKFANNVSSFETECMANKFGENFFKHPESNTPAILKRTNVTMSGKADQSVISAYSFKEVKRVEYVSKYGGDGAWHNVPVEWIEYVPLVKETEFSLQKSNADEANFKDNVNNGKIKEIIGKYMKNDTILYKNGLISFLASSLDNGYNGEELNKLFKE